eukprot:jgi/Tetstr1/428408/TSEL_001844.t1
MTLLTEELHAAGVDPTTYPAELKLRTGLTGETTIPRKPLSHEPEAMRVAILAAEAKAVAPAAANVYTKAVVVAKARAVAPPKLKPSLQSPPLDTTPSHQLALSRTRPPASPPNHNASWRQLGNGSKAAAPWS